MKRQLARALARRGVLTRETVALEGPDLVWRTSYPLLTRMEWGGEVERARFVSGLSGPQFASMRASRFLRGPHSTGGPVLIHVSDPANLYGRLFPILRGGRGKHIIRHHSGNYLVLDHGEPTLAVERRGERLIPLGDPSTERRRSAFALLPQLVQGRDRPASMRIKMWDGHAIPDEVADELTEIGFTADGNGMVLYRSFHEGKR
jgi:hypothetical protein